MSRHEVRSEAGLNRGLRQCDTQMCFADTRWAEKNDVAGLVDEPQRAQLADLSFVNRRLKAEVELIEGLHKRQVRQLRPGPQISATPRIFWSLVDPGEPPSRKEIRDRARRVDDAIGCEAYRVDVDMYAVCKKRGLPTRRSSHGGFAYRPMDQDIASAALPPECRGVDGQPKWNGAPEVIEWAYCDNLNSGCEYYLFVQRFTSLDDLRLKDTLTSRDKVQAFVQACRQETFSGSHELAYVGTYPLTAQDFLDVLFGTQTAVRPKDAFGFDGMRRQGLALAPPPPFRLESFLLDMSLAPVVRKLNAVVREFEMFRDHFTAESNDLAKLEHAKALNPTERERRSQLTQNRDVLFVKTFNELHANGVVRDHKPSNASAADALMKAIAVYPAGDPRRERFEDLERRLREALKEFDAAVNAAINAMSHSQPGKELAYHLGDSLFLFLKGTGSSAPKLRLTLRIRQLADSAETLVRAEPPLGFYARVR